jgi:hypothetical protein
LSRSYPVLSAARDPEATLDRTAKYVNATPLTNQSRAKHGLT